MYETFEHTADLGLRVRAPDLDALFAEAGRGLLSILLENPASLEIRETVEFRLEAGTLEDLLLDWVQELLFHFETERRLLGRFEAKVSGTRLEVRARGERLELPRHRLAFGVKAATYHGLVLREEEGGWLAEVVLDI
jgi:SHS2 domain-containing protein